MTDEEMAIAIGEKILAVFPGRKDDQSHAYLPPRGGDHHCRCDFENNPGEKCGDKESSRDQETQGVPQGAKTLAFS